MSLETPHPLPSGNSVLPSVAWAVVKREIVDKFGPEKADVVLLANFDRTIDRFVYLCRARKQSEDAIEIVRCGMLFRRRQLDELAEREGREQLIERLYAKAIGGVH